MIYWKKHKTKKKNLKKKPKKKFKKIKKGKIFGPTPTLNVDSVL